MAEQLSPCTTAIEPVLSETTITEPPRDNYWSPRALEPIRYNKKPPQWETWARQLETSPHSLPLEKNLCSGEDTVQAKDKQINIFLKAKKKSFKIQLFCGKCTPVFESLNGRITNYFYFLLCLFINTKICVMLNIKIFLYLHYLDVLFLLLKKIILKLMSFQQSFSSLPI